MLPLQADGAPLQGLSPEARNQDTRAGTQGYGAASPGTGRISRIGKRISLGRDSALGEGIEIIEFSQPKRDRCFKVATHIAHNGMSFKLSSLLDTGAGGKVFLHTKHAIQAGRHCQNTTTRLKEPIYLRGFNDKTSEAAVTHTITFHLTVDRHRQVNMTMHIADLGRHDMILGRE